MIQRMFVTLDTKKTNYKNVGKINHGDDLILELTVLSDGDMISFNDPMVDLLVKKSDGKMIRQNSGIEHIKPNKFIIEVMKDCVTSPGLSTNQLVINDNGRISTCMFYYTILNSLEEDIIQSISNVEVLEQLDEYVIEAHERMESLNNDINKLEEFFGATSDTLVEAEMARNEAEQKRVQSEILRVNNENDRIEADNIRNQNDSIRNQNELDRSSSELVREQRESERILNEEERRQNESKRATDELVRQQNESVRQSNESVRISNENDRKTQENRRVTAETNRVNAETTRRNNENSRISNEIERQKAMNEMKSLLEDARDFDGRVRVIEDEIEGINSSLDNIKNYKTYVTYKEFGAFLNGVVDDTQYIKACHEYANKHGLKVIQQNSLIVLSDEIEVKTDLDLTGSTVISKLKDNDVPYNRTKSLYKITGNPLTSVDVVGALTQGNRDLNISYNGYVAIMGNEVYMKRYNLSTESNVLNWENNYINNKKLTYPLINDHTNYTLSIREDDIPLSIKGCKFITEYNLSKALSLFRVERNNVIVDNVQLNTVSEGDISPLYTIVNVSKCCNVTLNNIQCDKMSNADANGLSYFILLEMCNNITIDNCKQGKIAWSGVNGNFIRDIRTNNSELFMYGCHAFGTDMSIKNSKIYNGIQIHGTGELNVENCIFYDNGISNKLDYGGEFRGTWNIKNCKSYNVQRFIYLSPPNYNHGKICSMPNINIDGLYFETTKNNNNIIYLGYLDNQTFDSYLCKDIKIKNVVVETSQAHRTFEIIYPIEKNLFNEMNLAIDNLKINRSNYITQGWYAERSNIQIPAIIDNTVLNININNSVANFGVRGTRNVNANVNNSEVLMLRETTNYIQTNGIMNMTIQNSVITRPYCNLTRTSVNLVSMNNIFKKGTDGVIGNGFAECVKLAKNNICEVGATIRDQDKPGLYNYIDTTYWTNS